MTAGPGYDNDHALYNLSNDLGFQLVCPIRKYRNTPSERLDLIDFHESAIGQVVYSQRDVNL